MIKVKEVIKQLKKYDEEQELLVMYSQKGEVHRIAEISTESGIINPNYQTLFIYTEALKDGE